MSYLDKLLDGVDVEWSVLGNETFIEIANSGRKPVKADLRIAGEIPYYGANNIQDYVEGFTHNGEYILIAEDGTQSIENYSIQWATGKFWANNHVHVIRGKEPINSRFLYHYLKQVNFVPYLSGGGRAKLTKGEMEKIPIPIPPLKIQKEIVRTLDKFTELTAELTARKKQYNYYREQLLTFDKGEVEWKTLGEVILKSFSGSTPLAGSSKYYENGTIPWLRTQEVKFTDIKHTEMFITDFALKNTSVKWIPSNCVIIAMSGATAGRSAINKIPLTTNQHCLCLEVNQEKANYRYVFHWVSFNFENIKNMGQGARGDLNSSMIKNFKIPIPSLNEQERIVSILDKFDILTTSISEGLPKEIELRKKQYEYYRNLLLTFPKNNIMS